MHISLPSHRSLFIKCLLLAIILIGTVIGWQAYAGHLLLSRLLAVKLKATAPLVSGGVNLTTLGSAYTQNFDTLVTTGTANTWTDDVTLPGWFSQFSLQPVNPITYRADSGGSNTGAIYSWGVASVNVLTERAFGSVASGTPGDIYNSVKLTNNTG
ncbi:MAG TPA: hypothetical protein VEF04_17140, partial [Blastocatellia bacterium]|nr:hypothetical protein [Blastocatellia bacterium]